MDTVTAGYARCGTAVTGATTLSTATLTAGGGGSIGGMSTMYYPANTWMPNNWYPYQYPYPYYWPTYCPNNEAALRETIREKEAVIEEMRALVKMQRQLLKALLPGKDK